MKLFSVGSVLEASSAPGAPRAANRFLGWSQTRVASADRDPFHFSGSGAGGEGGEAGGNPCFPKFPSPASGSPRPRDGAASGVSAGFTTGNPLRTGSQK